jgi:thiol-disulfide isomerase/thioredoxin
MQAINKYFLTRSLLLLLFLISCHYSFGYSVSNKTIISGYFEEYRDYNGPINLFLIDISNFKSQYPKKYTAHSNNGKFRFDIQLEHPVYFSLLTKDTSKAMLERDICGLFYSFAIHPLIFPGDSLVLNIDTLEGSGRNKLSRIKFYGLGASKNNCLTELFNFLVINYSKIVGSDSLGYLRTQVINLIEKRRLPKKSSALLKADFLGIFDKIQFENCLRPELEIEQKRNRQKQYKKFLEDFAPASNPIMQYSAYAKGWLIRIALCESFNCDTILNNTNYLYGLSLDKFFTASNRKYKGDLKECLIASTLYRNITDSKRITTDTDSLINHFMAETKETSIYREQLLEGYNNLKSILIKGSLDFDLVDSSGHIVTLKNYAGKVVLIDFMFNGCGGCKKLTPLLSRVEEKFKGITDVVFISISIDPTIDKFKKGVGIFSTAESLPLYTGGKTTEHDIIKYYGVNVFPTLVLIDRNSKVIRNGVPNDVVYDDRLLTNQINACLNSK